MVYHLVFDGVSDGSVGIGLEVMGVAARVAAPRARLGQRLVSVDGAAVCTRAGRPLAVDGALPPDGLGPGDVLVVPGLGAATPPELEAALARPDLLRGAELVAEAARAGALVAASCSATFVLGASGVLDGGRATTTWWLGPVFARRFPRVSLHTERMVVESGGALTAGSAFAHADLMLAVVSRLASPEVSRLVAQYLVLDERASQARYMVLGHLTSADPVLSRLEAFVVSHLERQISLEEMARATATSARTLARRVSRGLGVSPRRFVQRLRIQRAVHLLETTRHPVDEIAALVGYADPAAFRRVFRRETGETPRAHRRPAVLRDREARP
jgi:transcriptional regulator GlxA family with amidase domain